MSKKESFYIYGRNPVEEALKNRPRQIEKILVRSNLKPSAFFNIKKLSEDNNVQIQKVPAKRILSLIGRVNDQGIVAKLSQIQYTDYFEWIETVDLSTNPAVLLLDGLEDPYNFGAILRTAAASGIRAVIVPSQKQSPVNAAVFKTSAGTAGKIPIIRVHNTNQGIKDLKLAGFSIIGMDGNASETIWDAPLQKPLAFVIGNEGQGISKQTLKKCDHSIRIPMENEVESLNASVSAALVCYEWKRQQSKD
ncbi:MAG: 23S rRNA (guanosine(2251)-2'-O)-methyltransferase RlmB [Balneolaceae bacterium]|nr:23S rRNA (guanosine(2251)-2'-O)-methyltransferase RlmB [Balneolaceae bacterium]